MTDLAKGSHYLPTGEISNHYTWGYMLPNDVASDQRYEDTNTGRVPCHLLRNHTSSKADPCVQLWFSSMNFDLNFPKVVSG